MFIIRPAHMDNLKGLFGLRRTRKMVNARVRKLCGTKKRIVERIDKNLLQWPGHTERRILVLLKWHMRGVCA